MAKRNDTILTFPSANNLNCNSLSYLIFHSDPAGVVLLEAKELEDDECVSCSAEGSKDTIGGNVDKELEM